MSESDRPEGQLFSRVYLERGKPKQDSHRFRSRFGYYIGLMANDYTELAANVIRMETGTEIDTEYSPKFVWKTFFRDADLRDVLDSITIFFRTASSRRGERAGVDIVEFANRVFREENVGYQVDAKGGVHFFVDEEFEASRNATLTALSGNQNDAARQSIEEAHFALRSGNTLLAVVRAFDAVENRFKIDHNTSRIGATEVKQKLTPIVEARYEGRVADAAKRMIVSLAEWTNASHQFRHAPGTADPSPPPEELALLMVSEAMAYVRWLVSLAAK